MAHLGHERTMYYPLGRLRNLWRKDTLNINYKHLLLQLHVYHIPTMYR